MKEATFVGCVERACDQHMELRRDGGRGEREGGRGGEGGREGGKGREEGREGGEEACMESHSVYSNGMVCG